MCQNESGEQRIVYNVYKTIKEENVRKPLKRTSELVGIHTKQVKEMLKREYEYRRNARKMRRSSRKLHKKVSAGFHF